MVSILFTISSKVGRFFDVNYSVLEREYLGYGMPTFVDEVTQLGDDVRRNSWSLSFADSINKRFPFFMLREGIAAAHEFPKYQTKGVDISFLIELFVLKNFRSHGKGRTLLLSLRIS